MGSRCMFRPAICRRQGSAEFGIPTGRPDTSRHLAHAINCNTRCRRARCWCRV